MLKKIICISCAIFATHGFADDKKNFKHATVTYQTLPGSSTRDNGAPAKVTQGNETYQTLPGTSTRDWNAPKWVTKDGVTYQTLPGSSTRDWSAPSYKSEKK